MEPEEKWPDGEYARHPGMTTGTPHDRHILEQIMECWRCVVLRDDIVIARLYWFFQEVWETVHGPIAPHASAKR